MASGGSGHRLPASFFLCPQKETKTQGLTPSTRFKDCVLKERFSDPISFDSAKRNSRKSRSRLSGGKVSPCGDLLFARAKRRQKHA